jgi:hypothetical protein
MNSAGRRLTAGARAAHIGMFPAGKQARACACPALERKIVMKNILCGLAIALGAVPAYAAVEAAPAPAIGLGLPAIASVILVGLITLLLKHTRD